MRHVLAGVLALLLASAAHAEDGKAAIEGGVSDPQGGAVRGASVTAAGPAGTKSTRTGADSRYSLAGLAPGRYELTVSKDGFAPFTASASLVAGRTTTLDASLALAPVEEQVTVKATTPAISLAPENNAGGIILEGADLDALPDDPDELAEALQALAGPAAGPSGGQVFVDGFTGGRIPPKSAIRQIRINANPYSAEYDRPGFGRIEIFTRSGGDRLRGETSFRFNDDSLNAQNPYAPNKPPYQRRDFEANLSGPLGSKKGSFFVDFGRRDVDDEQIVNATVLDDDLAPVPFNESILAPAQRTSVSPRLDWEISPAHTLSLRYSYEGTDQANAGIGGFSLPSRAYSTRQRQHTLQLSETAILGNVVNEIHARFWASSRNQGSDGSVPTLEVQDAFTGGGPSLGEAHDDQKRFELQNVSSWSWGRHSLRAGARLRTVGIDESARQNFAGTAVFAGTLGPELDAEGRPVLGPDGRLVIVPVTSLDRYRRTLLLQGLGLSPAAIRALGGGASQLTLSGGDPAASVSQWDVAPFVQDDWRARPNLIVSLGLRYELQNNIDSHLNLAPRLAFNWSPGAAGPAGQGRTVVRGAFGIFYDRVGEDLALRSLRYDGEHTQQYLVTDPAILDQLVYGPDETVLGIPSVAELAAFAQPQATWVLADGLQAPVTVQSSLSLERQLPAQFTLSATLIASQGRRLLRSRNVNAPRADGSFPLGEAAGSVYQVESTGRLNQLQLVVGVNNRLSRRLSLFFRYFLARARSDTDGASTFPADSYDLDAEYGRAAIDVRHRVVVGGNLAGPFGIRISPFAIASTGRPFNITVGRDLNQDGLFSDRPAFANDPSAADVVATDYGLLDPTPLPGEAIIPRNYGEGPGFVTVDLRLSRTFSFGTRPSAGSEGPPRGADGAPPPRGGHPLPGGAPPAFGGGGRFGGGRGGHGDEGGPGLTVSLSAQNLLNHTNPAAPVANLSSPFFGQSLASAGGFGFGPGGATAGSRRIELAARLSF